MIYTLRLGKVDLDHQVIPENATILVRIDVFNEAGTDDFYCRIGSILISNCADIEFLDWIKVEYTESSSHVAAENIHPHCPSILIEDRVDISESVSERVQKVLTYDTIHFPLTETPTQAQAISSHVFHWNINTYLFDITC